jgi:F-type H+-transporting ATPase subunit b
MHPLARTAVSAFGTGLVLFTLAVHHHELPGTTMSLIANPEFWVALGFVAVIGIFVWQGVPRMVGSMLDARAAAIKSELDEARKLREEANALLTRYRAQAASAEKEAESIVIQAKAEAERVGAEARAHLRTQIERRTQMAQEKIAQAEAQAMADIRAAAADVAAAAAEKLIAARLDETRASAIIEQSIKDLPEKLN